MTDQGSWVGLGCVVLSKIEVEDQYNSVAEIQVCGDSEGSVCCPLARDSRHNNSDLSYSLTGFCDQQYD